MLFENLFKASKKSFGTVGDGKPLFRTESDAKSSHIGPKVRNCPIKLSARADMRTFVSLSSRGRKPECSASLSFGRLRSIFLRSPDQGPVDDNDTPLVVVCVVQIIKVFFDQRTLNQVINTIFLHCQWTKVVRSRKNVDLAS